MTLIPGQSSCDSRLLKRLSEIAVASHLHLLGAEERLDACWDSREPNSLFVRGFRLGQQRRFLCGKGNRLRAAQVLGIGRTSLYRYLKEDGYDHTLIARSKAAGQ